MNETAHALIKRFFADLGGGALTDDAFTADATAWTLTTKRDNPAAQYCRGTKALASLFPGGLTYTVQSVTVEEDRAAAEVTAHGVLHDGNVYDNQYVLLFRVRDGQIARLAEYFDPKPVEELITPLLIAAMGGASPRAD